MLGFLFICAFFYLIIAAFYATDMMQSYSRHRFFGAEPNRYAPPIENYIKILDDEGDYDFDMRGLMWDSFKIALKWPVYLATWISERYK